ncbi:MAG: hypothetical protein JXQ87_19315 [Bacteroidia bacterium]
MPLLLVASLTWVSQKHQCLSECEVAQNSVQASCCDNSEVTFLEHDHVCCANEDGCAEKDCCVDEKIVFDKTIDDIERTQRKSQTIALFDFLFAPLTQDVSRRSIGLDSNQSNECIEPDISKKSVSIYLLNQNIRC